MFHFVLIKFLFFFRYSTLNRSGEDCHWKHTLFYSQVPREGSMPCNGGMAGVGQEKSWVMVRRPRSASCTCEQEPLPWFLQETGKVKADLGLASLNNFRELWGMGVVSSFPVLVPGWSREEESGPEWLTTFPQSEFMVNVINHIMLDIDTDIDVYFLHRFIII